MRGRPFTGEEITLNRVCAICGSRYTLAQADTHFFTAPYNYRNGCAATCLKCWLGCGPDDKDEILPGNLLKDFALTLGPESHLVLMPIYRLMVSEPIRFQSKSIIYPHRIPKLDELNLVLSDKVSKSLTAFQSSATFVDKQTLLDTPTIAFTYGFDWDDLWHSNRHGQMHAARPLRRSNAGILLRPLGNVIYVLPPYCITAEELHQVHDRIATSLAHIPEWSANRSATAHSA